MSFSLSEASFDEFGDDLGLGSEDEGVNATIDGNTVTITVNEDGRPNQQVVVEVERR